MSEFNPGEQGVLHEAGRQISYNGRDCLVKLTESGEFRLQKRVTKLSQ